MLKAGMWIAQGPELNVLLLLGGKQPLLEVLGAIDLNHFNATGKAKDLDKDSEEVTDILMYPEKYNFEPPSITDAIKNAEGLGSKKFEGINEDDAKKEKMLKDAIKYYKSTIAVYGLDKGRAMTKNYIRNKYNMKMSQASYMFSLMCKMLNRPET